MAQIVGGGPPANDSERKVIAHLRDHAPDDWLVLHNVEVPRRDETFEVDVVVVTGHAVYLIDVKGTRGRIEAAGARWFPSGRQPFGSPVSKLKSNARALKGLLVQRRPELSRVYVGSLVVLTAPDASLIDPDGRDSTAVATLSELIGVLSDVSRVPERFSPDVAFYRTAIIEALHGVVRAPTGPLRFGHWEVLERLGGDDEVTEYRARNTSVGRSAETVLLRVYRADPFLPEDQRTAQQLRIANAYQALIRMPPHRCIVGRRDFFPIDDESRFVLVLDDVRGQALHIHLSSPRQALSADAKWGVIADILRGLAHAHAHRVIHRALSPATVLVTNSGRALLTGFDYARTAEPREYTVVDKLAGALDAAYVAPECHGRPEQLSAASDVYAAGVIAYQLLAGELPFASSTEQREKGSVLPTEELAAAGIPQLIVALLQRMCALKPSARPSAAEALQELQRALGGRGRLVTLQLHGDTANPDFYRNLPEGYQLTPTYSVRRRLGKPGTFGVAYQVYDNLADTDLVVKLVLKDRESVVDRLRHEYQILRNLAPHPNVVRVHNADYLPGGQIPYLAFEYVEGQEVTELIDKRLLGPADAVQLGIDVARGLLHLHENGVYHCDIKPSNLLWTDQGCKIIDFNVAVTSEHSLSRAGGTVRYAPPDGNGKTAMTAADLADRDCYALGVTLYEVLTGAYPWDSNVPPPGQPPRNPTTFTGLEDLSDALASAVCKAIAPRRSDRYRSVREFLTALEAIAEVRRPRSEPSPVTLPQSRVPNANPFVEHLQTLYSQSTRSNRGTRGRDPFQLYIETALDRHLLPDVLEGRYSLVVITGNAGDGKTAFLENLVQKAVERGANPGPPRDNGADFTLGGRQFSTNYDGSQDEGDKVNDDILIDFFAPFQGADDSSWPTQETRLIAINEGRLIDFLTAHAERFPRLAEILKGGADSDHVAVVNLNRRSVVADTDELNKSIFDRMLAKMTDPKYWEACQSCDLATVCYAPHNARTFAHPSAGPRVTERLRAVYTLTHLRGRLHITLRDLRSALAFMLTSGRDCRQIHELYADANAEQILDSFYFNSWAGTRDTKDRLLTSLREVDIAAVPDPQLDRRLDYVGPDNGALMTIDQRGHYDAELLRQLFARLPRSAALSAEEANAHARYLASARRRFFFECQDDERWRRMLPYRSAERYLELLRHPERLPEHLHELIAAINRGEGLSNPKQLGDTLALQVRQVPGGTIHSYQLFPAQAFTLTAVGTSASPYLESDAEALLLQYRGAGGHRARLTIRLDLYELLYKLHAGYVPGVADLQGRYLALTIFKNELSAAPYQEVLLTTSGWDLHRIRREPDGRLVMESLGAPSPEAEVS